MKTILTQDEYQNQFVNFYDQTLGTGIGTTVGPVDDDEQDDGSSRPTVRDIGGGDAFNPMQGTNIFSGGYSNMDASTYVRDNQKSAKKQMDKSDSGFANYMKNLGMQQLKERPGEVAILGVASLATGLPLTAIGAVAGDLNRKKQYENATLIAASGGGNMMDLNGQTVSRAPGSKQYVGTLGDFTSAQIYELEELGKGFIPGTMQEIYSGDDSDDGDGTYTTTGKSGLLDATTAKALGGNYDAYGNWHSTKFGTVSKSGPLSGAKALASQYGVNTTGWTTQDYVNFSSSWKDSAKPGSTKSGIAGFFENLFSDPLRDSTVGEYKTSLDKVKTNISNYSSGGQQEDSGDGPQTGGTTISTSTGGGKSTQETMEQYQSRDYQDFDDGNDNNDSGGGSSAPTSTGSSGGFSSQATGDRTSGSVGFADGGRIGMQAGGAAPAGFVQGPPGQFSERETVADDQPMEVSEGTFVINAPAVEHAGSQDIRKMILDAYTVAREKGLDIGRVDPKLYEGTVDVALSKGEVVIPPELAKIIGYDRLEKINNRGKKEVSRRQEASEGGFLEQGYASGDKVTVYRGEPIDVDKSNLNVDYGYGKENVGKFHTPSIEKARNFAHSAGPGNQQILSRKVTIDELFDGVEEAWKTHAKQKTDYFKKMPKSELDKNVRFIRNMKKAYETGERSLESMVMFLQEQVFHDDKSKVNFIETFKNDPKSAGKLAGRAISKVATKAAPPLAILEAIGTAFTPKTVADATLQGNESFLNTN